MKNRDLIENTRKKVISSFRELTEAWKEDMLSSECSFCITDTPAATRYQFLSAVLSIYPRPESLLDVEREGLDLSVVFCQKVYTDKDGGTIFTSNVKKLENGDWDLGEQIFVSVDIYHTDGGVIHERELGLIKLRDHIDLEAKLSQTVLEISEYFHSKRELIFDSIESLKKST